MDYQSGYVNIFEELRFQDFENYKNYLRMRTYIFEVSQYFIEFSKIIKQ